MELQGTITGNYLHLPVKQGAPKRWVRLLIEGEAVREFEIDLAEKEPDFWAFVDVSRHTGKPFSLGADEAPDGSRVFALARQSDSIEEAQDLYRERHRPQFHFSSRRGWLNDPNGLVHYQGDYHLFYQHNPFGVQWGNMHWGHAVSRDLVHWEELADALAPDELGQVWSGSAVVDWSNTAGLQMGEEKALIALYTAAGGWTPSSQGRPYTQCLAYSIDRGRRWAKYAGNPVLGRLTEENRDPKVIWHEPTGQWVMALFLGAPKGQPNYALLGSRDLKRWTRLSEVTLPCAECPDFFGLPVDGSQADRKWVYWGADGHYRIGSFDGRTFAPESDAMRSYAGNAYAAQTYGDLPEGDGRHVQIAWLRGDLPGMPFNQQMTFPVELSLHTTEEGVRLFSYPIRELDLLRVSRQRWGDIALTSGMHALEDTEAELLDISARLDLGDAGRVGLAIRGVSVSYDVETGELTCQGHRVRLPAVDRRVCLRVLVDRASVEVFANGGRAYLPIAVIPPDPGQPLGAFVTGGSARLVELTVRRLRSIWE